MNQHQQPHRHTKMLTIPDTVWTENANIFATMQTEDVLHNFTMYNRYVNHPAFVSERPALELGLRLCKQELANRQVKLS